MEEAITPGLSPQFAARIMERMTLDMAIADALAEERRLGSLEPEVETVGPAAFLPKTVEEIRPLEEVRNAYARHALSLYRGNVHATARALQITDRTLLARLGDKPVVRKRRAGKPR